MNNTWLIIIGISFIFLLSTLGSAVVFLFRKPLGGRGNSLFLGFSSGLMIAASIWSLILPAINQSLDMGSLKFLPSAIGVVAGSAFFVLTDLLMSKRNRRKKSKGGLSKPAKLFLAVTLHNMPEGLVVGLAFGNALTLGQTSAFYSALWLAIGIGLQNFPESTAIAVPLRQELHSNKKAFFFSVLSGLIEPIMAVIGIFLSTAISGIMPWLLAFSAGAMLFVVAGEMLPEARNSHNSSISSWGFIAGFVLMMILDVALA